MQQKDPTQLFTLPNIPWEEKPAGSTDVVWRYSQGPIIPKDLIPSSNSIFNSAVVPFGDGFAGVFRCDNKKREMRIHRGFSKDGVNWQLENDPIEFVGAHPEVARVEYRYDPRVCWLEDRYYVTWCNGYHGPTIGVGYTYDFETFHQLENAFCPTIAMASCSRAKSTASTPCSAAPVIWVTPHLGICFIAKARTWYIGAVTAL
jgi:beta-1,4-mannooligosaccharide/beta-1,4-mannosyl-N-acetylglucosamine phosphorylase